MRKTQQFSLESTPDFIEKLLNWSNQSSQVICLQSNQYPQKYTCFEVILAVDAFTSLTTNYKNAFEQLKNYQNITKDWIFGYITYDVKNDTANLKSNNFDGLEFPELYFFQPKKIITIKNDTVTFEYLKDFEDEIAIDFKTIQHFEFAKSAEKHASKKINIQSRLSKQEYAQKFNAIQQHIQQGNTYELNFCQEFYAANTTIEPLTIFKKLNAISQSPFAVFLKHNHHYAICASPERYLQKEGSNIISQPIKGTSKRGKTPKEDQKLKIALQKDQKEQTENIMIVDLVRNDLSKTAKKGSVTVAELCKVYTFKQVHQLISTITSKIDTKTHPVDVIQTTFPMGSMTGVPKISTMKIIEDVETTKRGLYSGTIGYITPNGDFDFNVVIRTILYNELRKYISFSVGGAITAKSNMENEYNECLLKAKAMKDVLHS